MNSLLPMGERSVLATPNTSEDGSLAATAGGAPLRMATVYVPNGAIPENWWPIDELETLTLSITRCSRSLN
ncbi:MAG: hypothetical protein R3C09_27135 [Pirellulaceae bacterium]